MTEIELHGLLKNSIYIYILLLHGCRQLVS